MPAPGHRLAGAPIPERLRTVLDAVPAVVAVLRGPDLVVDFANLRQRRLVAAGDFTGRPLAEVLAPAAGDPGVERFLRRLRQVLETGEPVHAWETAVRFAGAPADSYWDAVMIPVRDAPGAPPAGVVLHATEVTRLVEARRAAAEAEHRFTTLFEANVIGVTITDEEQLLEANDAFLEMVGRTRQDLAAGLKWTELSAPESFHADELALQSIRRTGAASPFEKAYLRPDGSRVPVLISGSRLQSDPLRILATSFDLSERQAVEREVAALLERERDARFAAELAGARMSRLQVITAGLSASNSAEDIGRSVVHHALEDLSASAGLLARGEQDLTLAHAVGFDRDQVEQWRAFPGTLPAAVRDAHHTRVAVVLPSPAAVAEHGGDLSPACAAVAVPLELTDRVLGVLALAFREARDLTGEDLEFLLSLARQAAAALDRAQLYENRAYVARKLQEGLLPQHLAEAPGLETAVVYESISGSGEVGGDFYDFLEAADGRWLAVIGDVTGKGTDAAVVTGLARHTIRAIARMEEDPAAILGFLNGALRRHAGVPAFCTVGCTVLAPAGRGFTATVASGGHPYPIVVRAGGRIEEVEVTGTLLGVADDPEFERCELRLEPGDALVAYTDGVIDARRAGGERFGEQRLLAALRAASGGSAVHLAGAVEAAVREHHPGASADDRAILVLRVGDAQDAGRRGPTS